MKNKQMVRILALVVVLSMIFTTAVFATPGNKDVEKGTKKTELTEADYNEALQSLIEKEIVKGYGKGDYGLSGNVKRGDVIVMIIRALGLEDVDVKELGERYLDLMSDNKDDFGNFEDNEDKEAYYYGPIKIARSLGIAKGDGRYFKPNKPVTIQEVIWLISRAEVLLDKDLYEEDLDVIINGLKGEIGEERLNDFAKRRDVILMLYYILDEVYYDESEDVNNDYDFTIEYTLEADREFLDFEADDFIDALNEENGEELKYIMFESGNEKLYYDYYNDDDIIVNRTNKYFVTGEKGREISKITYVREDESSKDLEIEYLSYYNDDGDIVYIPGLIKITVEGEETVSDVAYTIIENNELQFKENDFNKSIDKVKFDLSSVKSGALYYGNNIKNIRIIDDKDKIYDDSELSKIFFIPKDNDSGTVTIKYTAYINNETYLGEVVINVLDKVDVEDIYGLDVYENEEVIINFRNTLDEKLNNSTIDKIDYVKLENPDEGVLWILDKEADSNLQYKITDLKDMVYEAEDAGLVDINYVAVDLDNYKAYVGTIEIEVEQD